MRRLGAPLSHAKGKGVNSVKKLKTKAIDGVSNASFAASESHAGSVPALPDGKSSSGDRKRPRPAPQLKLLSLVRILQSNVPESQSAKKLLLDLPQMLASMRGLILVLIGMGLYYSRHKRRVHLQKKCRFQVFKVEKMLKSATLWFESMGVSGNERVTLERSLAAFFLGMPW